MVNAAADVSLVQLLDRALSAQKTIYVQILALARQQSRYVMAGQNEELMSVLAVRHRLIDQVGPIDRQLQPYKGRWQEVLDGLLPADRERVGGLLKEVQGLLADILDQDERDKEMLTRMRSDVGSQITRAVTGGAAPGLRDAATNGRDTAMTVEKEDRSMPAAAVAPPVPRNLEDLHEVLKMYNEVTSRLQVSHERLQQEVVRLTAQLEQKNRELEMKKRLAALGEMAAGIAHEIRNPLGGIQLYAGTLAAEVSDRPAAVDLVRKISSGVKGLNVLVSNMLTFTREMPLSKLDEALSPIVHSVLDLAAAALLENNVTVRVHGSVEGRRVQADRRLLERVLLNLVLNAAEAVGEAHIAEGRIEIRAASFGGAGVGQTEIVVEDNGPGIPADQIERIFHPFFTTKHSGTGLGLAIVHRIIEVHGGRIIAENRAAPNRGAQFRILI